MYKKIMYLIAVVIFNLLTITPHINADDEQSGVSEELMRIALRNSIVRLNTEDFKRFIGAPTLPRDYSFIIMMTALSPQRKCIICRQVYEEYAIVANSWKYSPSFSNKLFFGMIDYDEGSEIFKKLKLYSAPVFLYFSTNGKWNQPEQMDIQRIGFAAETIGRWVAEKTDIQIRVVRPPNYSGTLVIIAVVAFFGCLLYLRRNNLDFLYNRTSWALASLSIVFAMTSGQMWNHIRGPPLMQRTQRGVAYIHGSTNGQFVIETYIVIIFNVAIALGIILMNEAMRGKGDYKKKKMMAITGMGLTAFFFSLLLSIFRSKAHGYPYSFLFK